MFERQRQIRTFPSFAFRSENINGRNVAERSVPIVPLEGNGRQDGSSYVVAVIRMEPSDDAPFRSRWSMLLAPPLQAEPEAPMYWRRRFRGKNDQARVVRAFAGHLLAGVPALDDVLLVLNELVVNAVRHTRSGEHGGHFVVEISQDARVVLVSVTDEGGPSAPALRAVRVPCEVDALGESGRGLLTVEALTVRWSWTGDATGRTVHATFPAHQ